MKKIVHVVMSLGIGGIENMVVDIANIQSRNHDVTLIVINNVIDEGVKKRLFSAVRFIAINRQPKTLGLLCFLNVYYQLLNIWPDQIHVHQGKALQLIASFILPKKIRIVHTVHDTGITFKRELGASSHLCAISSSVHDDLQKRYKVKSEVVYNGVAHHLIPVKKDYKQEGTLRIVQVGRLCHQKKGQDLLIDALDYLHKKRGTLNFTLDIIGGGSSEQYLVEKVKAYGLEDSVCFKGALPRDSVYEHLPYWDILIQPSRYEGFGLTVAEAMSSGVPVIVSDIEGPMEIIQHGKYGAFFESDNVEQLAHCIEALQHEYYQGRIQQKSDEASCYIKDNFDIEKTAQYYALL